MGVPSGHRSCLVALTDLAAHVTGTCFSGGQREAVLFARSFDPGHFEFLAFGGVSAR